MGYKPWSWYESVSEGTFCGINEWRWLHSTFRVNPKNDYNFRLQILSFNTHKHTPELTQHRHSKIPNSCRRAQTHPHPHRSSLPWLLSQRLHGGHVRSHFRPRPRIRGLYLDEPSRKALWSHDCWRFNLFGYQDRENCWWKQGMFTLSLTLSRLRRRMLQL